MRPFRLGWQRQAPWLLCSERARTCAAPSGVAAACRVRSDASEPVKPSSRGLTFPTGGDCTWAVHVAPRDYSHQCRDTKSSADDSSTSRGVVLSRAAPTLRSIETHPNDWMICPTRNKSVLKLPTWQLKCQSGLLRSNGWWICPTRNKSVWEASSASV